MDMFQRYQQDISCTFFYLWFQQNQDWPTLCYSFIYGRGSLSAYVIFAVCNCNASEKFCNINDVYKRVFKNLVNWHISMGILTRIARGVLDKIPIDMCKFTGMPMTRFKVSFMLPNFSQWWLLHTEKSFRNLIKSNRNQIVFIMYRLIWNSQRTLSVCISKSIGAW